jgi:hypothetical protein
MKLARLALALLLAAPSVRADVHLATSSANGYGSTTLDVRRVSGRDVLPERSWTVAGDPGPVALSRDGSRAAVCVRRPDAVLVVSVDLQDAMRIPVGDRIEAVEFYGDGSRFAVAFGSHVGTYDSVSGQLIRDYDTHSPVRALASYPGTRASVDPRSHILMSVANPLIVLNDAGIECFHPASGQPYDGIDVPSAVDLRVLPDARAFVRLVNGHVTIVDLRDGSPEPPDPGVRIPAASPWDVSADGKWIAFSGGRDVQMYDVVSDRVGATLPRTDEVMQVVVPDGPTRVLLQESTPMDGEARILDLPTGATAWHGNLAFGRWKSVPAAPASDDHSEIVDEVASRASQSSLDALAGTVASRASQSSLDALATAVASKSSQSSVNALATAVAAKSSQSSVDALATAVAAKSSQSSVDALATAVAAKSSQSSVDAVAAAVAAKSSQTSVDAVADDVDGLATDVAARASQASVDAVTSRVADVQATANSTNSRLDSRLDAAISTRASQASLDRLAADESDRADADASDHELILASVSGGARQQIEASLAAGVVQPIFLVPAGPGGDPAALGLTCPGLPAAGAPEVDADGLFETVRCVTRRAIDDLRAIGEDVHRPEQDFARAEADRLASPPRYRDAVSEYSSAMQSLARGH